MLTLIQRIEVILIPVVTILSAVLISIYGVIMIGDRTLELISIPLAIGMIGGLVVAFLFDKKLPATSFEVANQNIRRGFYVVISMAFLILLGQLLALIQDINLTLALMSGSLGIGIGILDFFCLILLYRENTQKKNEDSTSELDE
ncbi:MAG: hypothetical protein ACFFC7_17585 [Candidatus Hermodarchaeota archaeon]